MANKEILQEIPMGNLIINDPFWNERLENNRKVTLEHQYRLLEETGRLDNFRIVAGKKEGDYSGVFFNDSDVYKWLEAASYTLINHPDPRLEERMAEVVELIAAVQEKDGYL